MIKKHIRSSVIALVLALGVAFAPVSQTAAQNETYSCGAYGGGNYSQGDCPEAGQDSGTDDRTSSPPANAPDDTTGQGQPAAPDDTNPSSPAEPGTDLPGGSTNPPSDTIEHGTKTNPSCDFCTRLMNPLNLIIFIISLIAIGLAIAIFVRLHHKRSG